MLKDNLIMLRNIHGFSQEQIAEKIDISRQAYAKWESGATVPDVEKCSRLAQVYGVSLDSLIKEERVEGIGAVPPPPAGKSIWGTVTVNDRGQIVIPKAARDKFGVAAGDRLIVVADERGIALLPAETFEADLRKVMEMARVDADKLD
ncbi:MAG: helix-turn-helix domain-containing protein [Firmicutes bacterium]|nr:helix-turn-helix domain-containing protein [Bacillota bacterium]